MVVLHIMPVVAVRALYTSATRFQNTGDGLGRFNSSISGLTTTTNKSLTEIALGVRHAF